MNNPNFHRAIGRIRRRHWLHYAVQSLLMGTLVLAINRLLATGGVGTAPLASGGRMALLAGGGVLAGLGLLWLRRRMVPNLRRLAEENLRIYQSRILLQDSLLLLSGLPLLLAYGLVGSLPALGAYVVLLPLLARLTAPSAEAYQRWLLQS
ncbi:hypothetical protein [Hymenobacter psychrophilus]|uniref:Uncharacterized protein n=1 Tax=Hymenobacter psychrophilus TaxID=651662 RepID=A0A1H3J427_9BACT|nr:hypothetical protein [Hymenobacter psychrophilus]SDY33944.1 hypothetical protein SAMN04488069_107253 [Hymenobacter psychrophilus]